MLISPISNINQNNAHIKTFGAKRKDNENKTLQNNKVFYSLIGLGVIALACVSSKKIKHKKPVPIKTSTLQDLHSSFSPKEMKEFEEKCSNFDFSKYELFNQLQISHQTDIFKKQFLLLKLSKNIPEDKRRPVELPKIIVSNAAENELKKISDLFHNEFNFNSYQMNYENIALDNFFKELEKIANKPEKNKEYKTLVINHFDKFLDDIKQNKDMKSKFEKLIAKNRENNIMFIVKEAPENEFNEYHKVFLEFENKK